MRRKSGDRPERAMQAVFTAAACTGIGAVVLICLFLFANSLPAISQIGMDAFLFGRVWKPGSGLYGILSMILGSLWITVGALLIGVPVGFFTAVWLACFCRPAQARRLSRLVELLAGIPSVVYGFFGIVVLVPAVREIFGIKNGSTVLTASLLLGLMILPTIITVAQSALQAVPKSYYEGALALGATEERSVFYTVVPAAKSGILAGVVLGMGRAVGETTAVIMVAGNQPWMPQGLLKGVRTLTANIVMEMGYAADLHRQALIATALVLFVLVLLIDLCFSLLEKGGER